MGREKPSKSVTILDVAREASVSYSTVSRVLNNIDVVKEETRERVLQAADCLGYVANRSARSLAGGVSGIIGLLVRDLGTSYIGEIVRGIDEEIAYSHYDLMLYTTHQQRIKESTYVTMLTRGMADGLIMVLPRDPQAYLDSLHEYQFPYILVDHQGLGGTEAAVGTTNWQGAFEATEYLIQLGHHRIGFIMGTPTMGCSKDRLVGHRAALEKHRIAFDSALVYEGDFFQPAGYAGATALLNLPEPPTAIFASNDVMAFGAMDAIRERGMHIPKDISLIGFDDIPQTAITHPPLTTVHQPLFEMGRMATKILVEYIANPNLPTRRVELPTKLVIRESCSTPRV